MEAYSTGNRVIRGGFYYSSGITRPISYRDETISASDYGSMAFRLALYII